MRERLQKLLSACGVGSRRQMEELILACRPAMVFVEHDARFVRTAATHRLRLGPSLSAPGVVE